MGRWCGHTGHQAAAMVVGWWGLLSISTCSPNKEVRLKSAISQQKVRWEYSPIKKSFRSQVEVI